MCIKKSVWFAFWSVLVNLIFFFKKLSCLYFFSEKVSTFINCKAFSLMINNGKTDKTKRYGHLQQTYIHTRVYHITMCAQRIFPIRTKRRKPYNIYINEQYDMLSRLSHVRLSVCLYIRVRHELVSQFLRYRPEVLHTYFRLQEAAHLSELPILDNCSIIYIV